MVRLLFPIFVVFFFIHRLGVGIVSVQLVGTIGWLVYENPDVKEIHPQPLTAVLTCKVSTFSLIMSLVYNMVLILLCTLYAFKTRKIPENFNEAKYIGFTMYSTCIVWLAFLPIYFGTNNDYKVKFHFLFHWNLLFILFVLILLLLFFALLFYSLSNLSLFSHEIHCQKRKQNEAKKKTFSFN